MISNFIFGEGTGLTYEQLQRQRALAEQLAASGPGKISTVGEGINSAAHSISAALINRRADKADQKNREAHAAEWDEALSGVGSLFGGGAPAVSSSNPAPSYTPPPADPTDPTTNRFPIGQTGPAPETERFPIGEAVGDGTFAEVVEAGKGYTVVAGPDGTPVRREGTRAWRNNNPGNIEFGDFAKSHGAIGTDGRFAVFPSYEAGRQAKAALLFDSPSYRDRSISSAINRYAPPFENDTNRYASTVAQAVGVPLSTRISDLNPQQREAMLDAMEQVEGFKPGQETPLGGPRPSGPAPEGFALNRQPPQPAPQQLPPDNVVASLSPQPGGTMTDAAPPGVIPQQQPVQMAQAQPQAPQPAPQGTPQGFQLQGSGMDRAFSEMQQAGQPMPGAPQPRPQQQPAPQPQQPVTATQGQQGPTQAIVMQLLELASSPYASDSQKAIAQMLVQQYQQQNDPLRQLQIQQAQRELQQGPERQIRTGPDGIDRYVDTGEPVFPGVQPQQDQPDPTTGQREYQQAVEQGYQGTWMDYQRDLAEARRDQTTINNNMGEEAGRYLYGSDAGLPAGWRLDTQTGEASRIPGGPAEAEQQQAETAQQSANEQTQRAGDVVLQDIGQVRKMLEGGRNEPITGMAGAIAARMPGTEATDARALMQTIRANIGFDRLQQMRDASPTGGALGAINERELDTLQAVLGNLEFSQSKEQLLKNLTRLEDTYADIVHGKGNWSRTKDGEIVPAAPPEDQPADLIGGVRTAPPDNERRNGMTRQQFFNDPGNIAAAEKHGVTLEEMWEAVR